MFSRDPATYTPTNFMIFFSGSLISTQQMIIWLYFLIYLCANSWKKYFVG